MNDVFANWWRRAILDYLDGRDGPATVTELTRQLVAWRREPSGRSPGTTPSVERTRRRRVEIHVVEMDAFGLLRYDPDADTVRIPDDVTVSVTASRSVRSDS